MPPSLSPQKISKTAWYYENKRSLLVLVECYDKTGTYHQTIQFRIPLSMLKRSLKRMATEGKAKA